MTAPRRPLGTGPRCPADPRATPGDRRTAVEAALAGVDGRTTAPRGRPEQHGRRPLGPGPNGTPEAETDSEVTSLLAPGGSRR